jgi:hypothetical protein
LAAAGLGGPESGGAGAGGGAETGAEAARFCLAGPESSSSPTLKKAPMIAVATSPTRARDSSVPAEGSALAGVRRSVAEIVGDDTDSRPPNPTGGPGSAIGTGGSGSAIGGSAGQGLDAGNSLGSALSDLGSRTAGAGDGCPKIFSAICRLMPAVFHWLAERLKDFVPSFAALCASSHRRYHIAPTYSLGVEENRICKRYHIPCAQFGDVISESW